MKGRKIFVAMILLSVIVSEIISCEGHNPVVWFSSANRNVVKCNVIPLCADIELTSLTLSGFSNTSKFVESEGYSPNRIFDPTQLSITRNDIDDDDMAFLVTKFTRGSGLQFMNLSYNYVVNPWNQTTLFSRMEILDLSYNRISRAPLEIELRSMFSSFNSTLQVLNISNNGMNGEFTLEWFLRSSEFQILNADHNALSGTLNLTGWYQKLQQLFPNSANIAYENTDIILHQLFSFVNNSISDIIPSSEDFEAKVNISILIQYFNNFSSGILLGGNPYCENATLLFHRYLCRSSVTDKSYEINPSKSRLSTYIGAGVGVGLFLLLIIVIMGILWYLRESYLKKQLLQLRKVQEAMAESGMHLYPFPHGDLMQATHNFHASKKLGEGGYGEVYKGVIKEGIFKDKAVAIKVLLNRQEVQDVDEEQFLHEFMNEVKPFKGIKHKNLVELLGWCLHKKKRILVFEFVEGGDIADRFWGNKNQDPKFWGWYQRLNICLGVAQGLAYLHGGVEPSIIHRDIKASNVLLDGNLNPKIADFGLAKFIHKGEIEALYTKKVGTGPYAAPEYLRDDGILSEKYDVYSFGVLSLEIISGRKCEDTEQDIERWYLKKWSKKLQEEGNLLELLQPELEGECPPDEVEELINIALSCLDEEYRRRPTMSEVENRLRKMLKHTVSQELYEEMDASDTHQIISFDMEGGDDQRSPLSRNKWMSSIRRSLRIRSLGRKFLTNSSEEEVFFRPVEGDAS